MNPETLHDALGLLPSDLLTPVDRLRSAPRKPRAHWMRYASMAACLALMLWGSTMALRQLGLSTESMAQLEADTEYSHISGNGAPAEDGWVNYEKAPTECDCAPETPAEGTALVPGSTEIAVEPPATGCPGGPDKYYVGGSTGYSPALGHKEGMEYPYTAVIRSREALDGWFAEYRDFYDIDSFEAGYDHLDDEFFRSHDLLLVMLEEDYGFVYHEPHYLNAMQAGKWQLTFTARYQQEDRTEAPMQWLFFIGIEKNLIGENDSVTVDAEPYAVPEEEYVQAHTNPTEG